ncbi:MAG: NmrA family NAD(P)-binding protein [Rhodospirillales bacterium]|nr:NmrA family NAD(P)-binding protein [Rhodospirillales bacterium]
MARITVIGASGRQGLAQVRQALAAGYDVRAISRRPDALEARRLTGSSGSRCARWISMTHQPSPRRSRAAITSSTPTRCKPAPTALFWSERSARSPRIWV